MTDQEIENLTNCDKINICILLYELRNLYIKYGNNNIYNMMDINIYSDMYGYALYNSIPYNINTHINLINMITLDMSMLLLNK